MEQPAPPTSPTWSTNTKLLVAATALIIIGAMVVRFWHLATPLMIAFIVAYLLHPVASFFQRRLGIPWALAVSVIYSIALVLTIVILGISGFELVQQIESLIELLQTTLNELPTTIANLSKTVIHIGPFIFNAQNLPLENISTQLVESVRPLLGQTGNILAAVAGGAITTVGRLAFIVIISYFLLIESSGISGRIVRVNIPGYDEDVHRLSVSLSRIWNAFLRGQIIIFFITVVVYTVFLTLFGVRYAFGLALIAGLARFLPYIGPLINWVLLGLVAYFQVFKPFGFSPLGYTALVIGLAIVIDQLMDNMVAPRLMSRALRVHPAAVIVAVLIAADLLGMVGVVIAAPILASAILVGNYVLRKLMDQDPFPPDEIRPPQRSVRAQIRLGVLLLRAWVKSRQSSQRALDSTDPMASEGVEHAGTGNQDQDDR
jgi:predicted PurR-regulated permease PerM